MSRTFDFPWSAGLFAAADQPVILYTGADGEPPEVAAPLEVVRIEGPDPRAVMADLRARGVRALLCEGGPTLNSALLEAGVVDELFLTLSPMLSGEPGAKRIVEGHGPAGARAADARVGAAPRPGALPALRGVDMSEEVLDRAAALAGAWLETLARAARSAPAGEPDGLRGALPEYGEDPVAVIEALAAAAEPGLVASAGPRYFGFVTGGALPVAVAADWLTSAWDQNVGLHVMSPAAAAAEQTVAAG